MDLRIWNSVGRETLGWIGRVEKPSGGSARSRGLRAAWLGWKTFGWTSQVVKPSGGSARSQSLRAAWPGWKAFGWTSQVGKPSGRLTGEASGVFSGARCNDPVSEHLSLLAYFGPHSNPRFCRAAMKGRRGVKQTARPLGREASLVAGRSASGNVFPCLCTCAAFVRADRGAVNNILWPEGPLTLNLVGANDDIIPPGWPGR